MSSLPYGNIDAMPSLKYIESQGMKIVIEAPLLIVETWDSSAPVKISKFTH